MYYAYAPAAFKSLNSKTRARARPSKSDSTERKICDTISERNLRISTPYQEIKPISSLVAQVYVRVGYRYIPRHPD